MALVFLRDAQKQMASIPAVDRQRLVERLTAIAAEPAARHPGTTQLVNRAETWRVRQGDWRAIYRIVGADVVVIRAGHRREVYG